jgi:hypothetical protein
MKRGPWYENVMSSTNLSASLLLSNKIDAFAPLSKTFTSRITPYWANGFMSAATLTFVHAERLFRTTTHVDMVGRKNRIEI